MDLPPPRGRDARASAGGDAGGPLEWPTHAATQTDSLGPPPSRRPEPALRPYSTEVNCSAFIPLRSRTLPRAVTFLPALPAIFSFTETGFSLTSR